MITDLTKLPTFSAKGHLHVVVESPRGSGLKLKYDPGMNVFLFHRPLPLGLTYPYEWGFIPSTLADDGDPLDAMVITDVPSHPGVVIEALPIAVLQLDQKSKKGGRERNDRVLAIPAKADRLERRMTVRQQREVERFFINAVMFADKDARLLGWKGPREVEKLIEAGRRKFARKV